MKSMKRHLSRTLGAHTPTFEELTTLTVRIEACINSRPLEPLVDNCEGHEVLTQAHFSIGGPLTTLPDSPSTGSTASRCRLMQELLEGFWQCWSSDYLQMLQFRSKWVLKETPVTIGQMVLVHQPNLPPAK